VFVHTPIIVIAERLTGEQQSPTAARRVVRARLAANTAQLLGERRRADLVIEGTAERRVQVQRFLAFHADRAAVASTTRTPHVAERGRA
jgi:hypothetical protein